MLDVRNFSFSQRTENEWNKLSADYVHSSCSNMFKNRIDNSLVKGRIVRFIHVWTLDEPRASLSAAI